MRRRDPAASRPRQSLRTGVTLAMCALLLWLTGPAAAASPGADSWTVYHANYLGDGVATRVPDISTRTRAWTSPVLDGQIYGEPLIAGGDVYVATENDTVYALSAATGGIVWSSHVGKPVPADSLPCGNITPTVGITGTPVIDDSRQEIFVVADELSHGGPRHVLVGLSTTSGRRELTEAVDPPGADPAALLQRTGLTLDDRRVVFGMGGNYGDCSTYRGRLVAVPETGGKPGYFTVDAGPEESQGAIWMGGGAPAVDNADHLWVTTGNGSVASSTQHYDHSDAVLELSPSLRLLQYFAPKDWAANNASDLDMSTEPAFLPDGLVIAASKGGVVYLLDSARLGGIGGQVAELRSACKGDIDGGSAVVGNTVYLPCLSGIVAVTATGNPPALRVRWSSAAGGGPPIVAAGLVWTIGQNGTLYGLNPATGSVRRRVALGPEANHFATPSVGAGLLVAPCATNVIAFAASSSASGADSVAASPASPQAGCRYSAPGAPIPRGLLASAAGLIVLVVIGLGWLVLHRRRRVPPRHGAPA